MEDESSLEAEAEAAADNFALWRGKAINVYARLEHNLAALFEVVLKTDSKKAFAIFEYLGNYRARLDVVFQVVELETGDTHRDFLESLKKILQSIDRTRNKVVHWLQSNSITGGKSATNDVKLCEHPNLFRDGTMALSHVKEFGEKAETLALLIYYFGAYLRHGDSMAPGGQTTWAPIFKTAVGYPLPPSHPLHNAVSARWR